MDRVIRICIGDSVVQGVLNDGPTAALIWEALPISGRANLWGDEIYFSIPVDAELETTANDVVERRPRLLAAGARLLRLFWADAGEPGG